MTPKQIGAKLVNILNMPAAGSGPFAVADSVSQENLYPIQDALLNLAEKLDKGAVVRKFPYLYRGKKK